MFATKLKGLDTLAIRQDFPIIKRKINGKPLVYLDSGATSQKPKQVIDAMSDFYSTCNANVHRGIHKLSEEASEKYEEAHQKAANFIHSPSPEEIIFTKNATESLNLLAYSIGRTLKKGDEVVITQMEHHSNLVPWQQAAKLFNLKLKYITLDKNSYTLNLEKLSEIITPKTKAVSVTHMSNVLGTINPVKEIAKVAHDNGAVMVIDGAQSVPQMPVDVQKLGCDFLAFSGHKMLGPTGIGVLYGKKHLLEKLPPFLYGGGMIREVGFYETTFDVLPCKFEAGTPPIAEAVGLSAAIDYLQNIGMEKVREHEASLTKYALEKLSSIPGMKIFGPADLKNRGGVISFELDKIHSHDMSTLLDSRGIAIRGGHHCAMPLAEILGVPGTSRATFYIYNTKKEIDFFAETLMKVKFLFSKKRHGNDSKKIEHNQFPAERDAKKVPYNRSISVSSKRGGI